MLSQGRFSAVVAAIGFWLSTFAAASAESLPKGFVFLADIDATIRQDIRYAGSDNFTHSPVPGYRAAECVLAEATARALARVQQDLRRRGYSLLVFDCYRPAKAVRRFVEWARAVGTPDAAYHPHVRRNRLIAEGYIAARSGHSSGGTVDLTLVRDAAGGFKPLDMGTNFDFFDPAAATGSKKIPAEARVNRLLLVDAMAAAGFANYRREWWHFRDRNEPFAGRIFDFDIVSRSP